MRGPNSRSILHIVHAFECDGVLQQWCMVIPDTEGCGSSFRFHWESVSLTFAAFSFSAWSREDRGTVLTCLFRIGFVSPRGVCLTRGVCLKVGALLII